MIECACKSIEQRFIYLNNVRVIKKKCNERERRKKREEEKKNDDERTGETRCILMRCTMSHVLVDVEDTATRHAMVKVYLKGESWVCVTRPAWATKKSDREREKELNGRDEMRLQVRHMENQ